jgi:hypothetical protein
MTPRGRNVMIALAVAGSGLAALQGIGDRAGTERTGHDQEAQASTRTRSGRSVPRLVTARPVPAAPRALPTQSSEARFERFRHQVVEANRACVSQASCDPRTLQLTQAGLHVDHALGPDHPAREMLVALVGWSYDERQRLGQELQAGRLTQPQVLASLRAQVDAYAARTAEILDDQEYESLFNLKKGQSPADALKFAPPAALAMERNGATEARP